MRVKIIILFFFLLSGTNAIFKIDYSGFCYSYSKYNNKIKSCEIFPVPHPFFNEEALKVENIQYSILELLHFESKKKIKDISLAFPFADHKTRNHLAHYSCWEINYPFRYNRKAIIFPHHYYW